MTGVYGDDFEQARWMQPLDLSELGELTAQWLEDSTWGPSNGGSEPDPETAALVPVLAAMNRAGYVTDFSQPGDVSAGGSQRAAVSGFCAFTQADQLARLSLDSELIVITGYPRVDGVYEMPITQDAGRTFTIHAGRGVCDEPDALWPGCHAVTWRSVSEAFYVQICDPRWGRNDLLWPRISAALETDTTAPGGLIPPWESD
jgi:hypothetical protein